MKKKECKKMNTALKLLLIGAVSGFISGFFGSGGGVILIICATLFLKEDTKKIFAQTAIVTGFFSAVSAVIYGMKGSLPFRESIPLIPMALVGGAVGAFLLSKISPSFLRKLFGIVACVGGLIMILF